MVSIAGGFCAFTQGGEHLVDIVGATAVPPEIAHLATGTLDDWEQIEGADLQAILLAARMRREQLRIELNIESCLAGVSEPLALQLLTECEELLVTVRHREALSRLAKSPLRRVEPLTSVAELALSAGLASTASLLDELREIQAPLRRLADAFLGLPVDLFGDVGQGRGHIWRLAVRAGVVLRTALSTQPDDVRQAWSGLVFNGAQPQERIAIAAVARALAEKLWPEYSGALRVQGRPEPLDYDDEVRSRGPYKPEWALGTEAYARFQQVIKQIEAVVAAVEGGQDAKAATFLGELVDAQLARGDTDYAVKSLCNIAAQCADMFRTDFEFECLQRALDISPNDSWVQIQCADHLKRVGRFGEALELLETSIHGSDETVRRSSIADVYAQMGQHQKAADIYDELAKAGFDEKVFGAKADLLRRSGDLEGASQIYAWMVSEGYGGHRTMAGMAEIAKRQGQLERARELYSAVLTTANLESKETVVYRTALAHVLVRLGSYNEAFRLFDEVLQLRPFAFRVRASRAAVIALLGDAETAMQNLPDVGRAQAFDEWVGSYVRGLLLLMLRRYDAARSSLLDQLSGGLLDREASAVVRLGAAVSFLRTRQDVAEARRWLDGTPALADAFGDVVRAALQYHVAVAERNAEEIGRLSSALSSIADPDVKALVSAINRRDWAQAWRLEVKAVLRLAA